jgi:predicted CXXCH cytochrome family protein
MLGKKVKETGVRQWNWAAIVVVTLVALASLVSRAQPEAQKDSSDIQLRASCVDVECHADFTKSKYVHSPVTLQACNVCHVTVENRHVFQLANTPDKLCNFCHGLKLKNFAHEPVAKGECLKCHDSHSSEFPFLVKVDPSKELCFTCHEKTEKFEGKKYVHAPAEEGACILCHENHSSWNKNLLIRGGNDLCIFCHKKEFEAMLKMRHVHKPVVEEDCQKCHDPHGSNNHMMIIKNEPDFCYDCHEDIANVIKNSKHPHEATIIGESCSNCHSAHASSLPRLLVNPMFDVCLSCHNKKIRGHDGTLLENIAQLMEENPFRHGPIQQNNCIACHAPHGSNIFRRLVTYFPEEFYAPFDQEEYNLCFQCHTKDTFLEERSTALTNFRDGDLNLHFLHVNKEEKGRTCRACHEVHASKQKAHVRAEVPYGNWEFPLVFRADIDGGTCAAGCHEEKKYSRKYKKIDPLKKTISPEG